MKNWSLNAKFIFVVAILIVAGAGVGIFGINRLNLLNARVDAVIKVNVPRIRLANQLRDFLRQIAVQERNIIIESNDEEMKKSVADMQAAKAEFDKRWDHAYEIGSEKGREKLKHLKEASESFWKLVQESSAAALKHDDKTASEIARTKGTAARMEAVKVIGEILDLNQDALNAEEKFTEEVYSQSRNLMITVILLAAIGGIALTGIVLRALSKAIDRVIATLTEASQQVAQTAQQIAQASEELSQASNEQAASLQETSSSLEELTSMVAKNTENARATAENAHESLSTAESGKTTIQTMVGAIQELEKSNQQIAEILKVFSEIQDKTKVIEDIVFQTQLLSFNASVEAARAGEHGKGFAVVAEEVGNLAEMSGNASAEIATLLQNSLKLVEGTVEEIRTKITRLVEQGGSGMTALESIVSGVHTASTKINEISTASNEQSRGIEEINRAMTQLDQGTQQNAATSEEAASAAEELSGQAVALRNTVQDLVAVIKGASAAQAGSAASDQGGGPGRPIRRAPAVAPAKSKAPVSKAKAEAPAARTKDKVPASIPLADDPGFVNL